MNVASAATPDSLAVAEVFDKQLIIYKRHQAAVFMAIGLELVGFLSKENLYANWFVAG